MTLILKTLENFNLSLSTLDLEDLAGQYLKYIQEEDGVADTTIILRTVILRAMITYFNDRGVVRVTDIDHFALIQYFSYRSRTLKDSSVNAIRRICRWFFSWVIDIKGIELDIRPSKIKQKKTPDSRVNIVNKDQVARVVAATQNIQDKLVIALMFETGMRLSEVASFSIEDLSGTEVQVLGKGGRRRTVYITRTLSYELREFAIDRNRMNGELFRPLRCGRPDNPAYRLDTLRQRIVVCFKRQGIEMRPHDLRHSFAIMLLRMNVDLRTIQKLLGHAKLETTSNYLRVTDPYLKGEYNRYFAESVFA